MARKSIRTADSKDAMSPVRRFHDSRNNRDWFKGFLLMTAIVVIPVGIVGLVTLLVHD
jgi:hypothetical protein